MLLVVFADVIFQIDLLPPVAQKAAFIEILCVEGLVCWFTFSLAQAARQAVDSYQEIEKLAKDVKKPLRDFGKLLFEWKDLLPELVDVFKSVPKEDLRSYISELRKALVRPKAPTPDDLEGAAKRLMSTLDEVEL